MAESSDEEHLQYAANNEHILVSQDEDFAILHAQWLKASRDHWGIFKIAAHIQGQAMITLLVNELHFYHEAEHEGIITPQEFKNKLVYL